MRRRWTIAAPLLCLAASAWAAQIAPLPEPELDALEPSVAAQLSELRELAATVVNNNLASPTDKIKAWADMGRIYHAYELLGAAEICYAQVEALEPLNADWPYYRGHVALAQGDLDEALGRFYRALDLRPDDLPTLLNLADVESSKGRTAEARALLEKATELPTAGPVFWARLGELAVAEGRYEEGARLLTAVLEVVPQATRLHHPLGMAYRGLGDLERARHHLARRGDVGIGLEDPLMAELDAVQVGERVHLLRGRRAFAAGSYDAAATEFGQAVEARPESARARINLSAALAAMGDVAGALDHLQHAVALAPENPTARFNFAKLLASGNQHRLATVHFETATVLRPGDEDAWLEEAKSWIALGDFARATLRLSVANSTMPDSGRIAFGLARLLAAAPDTAVRDGEKALALALSVFEARRTPEHAVLVSLAMREQGRCDEARRLLDRLIAEGEAASDTLAVETLRAARLALGDAESCRP